MSGPSPFLEKDKSTVLTCRQCGAAFDRKPGRGRNPHFCSDGCRSKDTYYQQCAVRYLDCEICGSLFVASRQRATCGESCRKERARRKTRAAYAAAPDAAARRVREQRAVWTSEQIERDRERARQWREQAGYHDSKRAADERRAARQKVANRRKRALRKLDKAAAGSRGKFIFAAGTCKKCGKPFVYHQFSVPTRCFCSRRCGGKWIARSGQKRRKISRTARLRVHERCDWTCQICGEPADRDATPGEAGFPVIDHRIPLAAGGADDESNWQTAHWYCNSVKRDQVDFEFWTPEEVAA